MIYRHSYGPHRSSSHRAKGAAPVSSRPCLPLCTLLRSINSRSAPPPLSLSLSLSLSLAWREPSREKNSKEISFTVYGMRRKGISRRDSRAKRGRIRSPDFIIVSAYVTLSASLIYLDTRVLICRLVTERKCQARPTFRVITARPRERPQ